MWSDMTMNMNTGQDLRFDHRASGPQNVFLLLSACLYVAAVCCFSFLVQNGQAQRRSIINGLHQ